jgi:hypothetical protein
LKKAHLRVIASRDSCSFPVLGEQESEYAGGKRARRN